MVDYPPPKGYDPPQAVTEVSPSVLPEGDRDTYTDEDKMEMYVWLAEHPIVDMDPVRLAMASVAGLEEDELPLFFEQLRKSLDTELWTILTE